MINLCKIIGHKSPYFFIMCKLGNSFYYKKSYCRRCHENIGEYEGLHQRFWSALGDRWIWAEIDNKPVDLNSSCNNPRWLIPLVFSPDSFEHEFKYYKEKDGYGYGRTSYITKRKLREHYVDGVKNEMTMECHG